MKVLNTKIDNFISGEFRKFQATLIYGPDYGVVSERCHKIVAHSTNINDMTNIHLNTIHLKYKDIATTPSILENEIMSLSFFSKNKTIIIDEVDDVFPKQLAETIEKNKDHLIVFKAGDLQSSSAIRRFFETNKNVAALPCYAENTISIKQQISKILLNNNLEPEDSSILNDLVIKLQGNKKNIESEVNKIVAYYHNDSNIKIRIKSEIVHQIISDNHLFFEYESLFNAITNNDQNHVEDIITKMLSNGENIIAIIRSLTNFITKVLRIKSILIQNKNETVDSIVDSPTSQIFFKQIPIFKRALNKFSVSDLLYILERLTNAEIECKNITTTPEVTSKRLAACF
ncbi:MAG: DNA polymerase III subunit delta [Rickettsiales bacterium]|nr:DNA polymerase III subunit delta [Rickettsiales bacterium]